MNINEQLKLLMEMQEIDSEAAALVAEKNEKPDLITELKNSIEHRLTSFRTKEENYKKTQLERKAKELELQTKEESVKKQQLQLYQVKTNKEYSALQLEINKTKADNSLLEEEVIKLLEKIDSTKKEIDKEKNELKEDEDLTKQKIAAIEIAMRELDDKINQLNLQRAQISTKVDKEILARYERIINGKNDSLGIVEVKDSMCCGCFMITPPQVINEIKMNNNLILCERCARILYVKEEG
ncbi:MAG: C4-type zinc ribbon domain-containing protein [Candidatus Omnitrophota bacterium]